MQRVSEADALLVVDVQYDFLPGGALAVAHGDEVIEPILALLPRFHTVVVTQDFHPAGHVSFASAHPGGRPYEQLELPGGPQVLWPDHCVAGSHGAELHDLLRAPAQDRLVTLVLRKGTRREVDSYSAFRENNDAHGIRQPTGLGSWLRARGVGRVFLAGLARDYCVAWSALDAVAEGFPTVVLDPCTRPVFPERTAAVDHELHQAGVVVAAAP